MKKRLKIFLLGISCMLYSQEETPNKEFKRPIRVYADVVGDLLHRGHIEFFKKARNLGDYLIVGVISDKDVESYKRLPVLRLSERVALIEACKYVDEVIVAPPLSITEEFLKNYQIDLVVHGDDFDPKLINEQYGIPVKLGIMRFVPYTEGISTTEIIERIEHRIEDHSLEKKEVS